MAVVIVQFSFIDRLTIYNLRADILLIPVSIIAINYGKLPGTIYGFLLGFLMDLMTGFWGINSLTKTLAGYLWGNFYSEAKRIESWEKNQYYQVFGWVSLIHFMIYSLINNSSQFISWWHFIYFYLISQTLYTMVFMVMFSFYYWSRRRYRR